MLYACRVSFAHLSTKCNKTFHKLPPKFLKFIQSLINLINAVTTHMQVCTE